MNVVWWYTWSMRLMPPPPVRCVSGFHDSVVASSDTSLNPSDVHTAFVISLQLFDFKDLDQFFLRGSKVYKLPFGDIFRCGDLPS